MLASKTAKQAAKFAPPTAHCGSFAVYSLQHLLLPTSKGGAELPLPALRRQAPRWARGWVGEALEAFCMKITTERPMFSSMVCAWRGFAAGSVLPLKRTMAIREPSFDETGAQNAFFWSEFLCIANMHRPIDSAPRRAPNGPRHTCTNANYQSWFLSHGEKRERQDTDMSS
jgi:hypothetical protein